MVAVVVPVVVGARGGGGATGGVRAAENLEEPEKETGSARC